MQEGVLVASGRYPWYVVTIGGVNRLLRWEFS